MEQIDISKSALITGLILLISGFVIMALGSDTYSFWKISVSPLIIIIAFCVIAYSVMHKR
jgi:intracellular septation protein A